MSWNVGKGDELNHNSHLRRTEDKHSTSREGRGSDQESSTSFSSDEDVDLTISFAEDYDKHDWQREKQRKIQFFDDGTMSYFWRAHTLTVLIVMIGVLIYVGLFEETKGDGDYNMKRGLMASLCFFILLGVTVIPDGPFLRPHPAFWRLMFCLSIVYQLTLIFMLFQSANDARLLLRHIDPKLGRRLEEKSYGNDCLIYDPAVPHDPFHNVWGKVDMFVPTHFFGWWLKTIVLRDWWLCTVISIMFEILEYTLEHQLPNFSECWWDHWIMDALVCNGFGIYVGIKTLKYFQVKTYYWRGLWSIPGYRAKLKRIFAQFGPYSWIEFDWKPTSSLVRWVAMLGIIFVFLMAELNTFYLKFVLWVPPSHWINLVRVFGILFWGAVSLRETFQYLDDPDCTTFGRQSWIVLSIITTEFLIVAKFDWETINKPLPQHISYFWLLGLVALIGWTIWNFRLYRISFRSRRSAGVSKSENDTLHRHHRDRHHQREGSGSQDLKSIRSQSLDTVNVKGHVRGNTGYYQSCSCSSDSGAGGGTGGGKKYQ